MFIVGERINTSRKGITEAIEAKDSAFIQKEAAQQVQAGAHIIDVNAGTMIGKEVAAMEWLVRTVQETVDVPLSIDSPNPAAIEAGLKVHKGKAMVNSISGEEGRAEGILPLVKKYDASVVALTMDDKGMPDTAEERLNIARNLLGIIEGYGISADKVYFDPLVRPIGTDTCQGMAAMEAITAIMAMKEGVHTICGLSNISFGLPKRKLLNKTFLALSVNAGLDAAILDPTDLKLMSTLRATEALLNKDDFCMQYITADRESRLEI